MPRLSKKRFPVQTTLGSAVSDACQELQSLRDELSEWRDNLPESLQSSQKYDDLDTAVGELDAADDEPEVPEWLQEIGVEFVENRRRSLSRSARRDNAVAALEAVVDAADAAVGELETAVEELRDAMVEFESMTEDDDTTEWNQAELDVVTKARALAPAIGESDELELDAVEKLLESADEAVESGRALSVEVGELKDAVDSVEFPGMY